MGKVVRNSFRLEIGYRIKTILVCRRVLIFLSGFDNEERVVGVKFEIDIVKKRVFIFWCGLKDSTFRRGKVDTGPQLEYLSFERCGMGSDHFITCTFSAEF